MKQGRIALATGDSETASSFLLSPVTVPFSLYVELARQRNRSLNEDSSERRISRFPGYMWSSRRAHALLNHHGVGRQLLPLLRPNRVGYI